MVELHSKTARRQLRAFCFKGTIPTVWRKISYPSQSSLLKYLTNLRDRVDFFRGWVQRGKPDSFWLGGFFFPQSFLTAILQNFARKNSVTVDQVTWVFLTFFPRILNKNYFCS
jgi:dynein heavy chain